jgi:hypothetical protein
MMGGLRGAYLTADVVNAIKLWRIKCVWSMQESVRGENSYKLLARNIKVKDTYNTLVQIRG